jgi:hypothetical protein
MISMELGRAQPWRVIRTPALRTNELAYAIFDISSGGSMSFGSGET